MNRIPSRTRFVALALAALPLGACSAGSSPDALAGKLQAALGKGDFKAARALANLDDAPADVHFFYLDMVRECGSEATCTVKAEATSAEACSSIRENAAKIALKADGCLVITSMAKDASGSGTMKLPFVNRDGDYKVATIGYSVEELAALRAKTSETLLNELFSKGLRDSGSGELRTDWATASSRLPADGGAPGKAFVAQTRAMAAAIDAGDPDAAMRSGGELAAFLFRDKEYDGMPIPLATRQQRLQLQGLRVLRDVSVSGGYQLGETAVLLIEARDGIGWAVHGPIVLAQSGEHWDKAGDNLVSLPPGC